MCRASFAAPSRTYTRAHAHADPEYARTRTRLFTDYPGHVHTFDERTRCPSDTPSFEYAQTRNPRRDARLSFSVSPHARELAEIHGDDKTSKPRLAAGDGGRIQLSS